LSKAVARQQGRCSGGKDDAFHGRFFRGGFMSVPVAGGGVAKTH
jgi:hypothetical protein